MRQFFKNENNSPSVTISSSEPSWLGGQAGSKDGGNLEFSPRRVRALSAVPVAAILGRRAVVWN